MSFYAVAKGYQIGVYTTWDQCKKTTAGFSNAIYKKFANKEAALAFIKENSNEASSTAPQIVNSFNPSISATTLQICGTNYLPNSPLTAVKIIDDRHFLESDTKEGLVIFTDGSCKNNQRGGVNSYARAGVYLPLQKRGFSKEVPQEQTNNRAELYAILLALEFALTFKLTDKRIFIYTDSNYSIDILTGRKKAHINKDLHQSITGLFKLVPVTFRYVKGHDTCEGNNIADALANGSMADFAPLDKDEILNSCIVRQLTGNETFMARK